jgi:hypothetical protein
MTKKQLYETPEAEVLVVKIEQALLQTSVYGEKGTAGKQMVDDDDYTYSL